MKFLLAVLLSVLAASFEEEACTKEKAAACVEDLQQSLLGETSEEEKCSALRSTNECLRQAADDCSGEDQEEIEEGLEEYENLFKEKCDKGESGEDISKCLEKNEGYMLDCMSEVFLKMTETNQEVDENAMQCDLYAEMSACLVIRVEEKCGEVAAALVEKEMSVPPEEIREACDEGTKAETPFSYLVEFKRKK